MTAEVTKPVRIAVAGAGLIVQEHIKRVLEVRGAELAGIVDPAPKAKEQAENLGVSWYPDLEVMLAQDKPDGVVVGLPNQFHFKAGMELIKHGVPMLMEKPVCDSVEEAIEFADAAEKANVAIDPDDLWVKTAFVDRGPTKNRRRVRPAPQGRAYREQRHFCHVTILLSNDARPEPKARRHGDGKAVEAKPAKLAESKARKRGGAAAAPRAKRVAPKTAAAEKPDVATESEKKSTKRAAKKKVTKKDE